MALYSDSIFINVISVIAIILGLIYYYLTSTFSFWRLKGIPYIKPEIFFGNMKDIVTFKMSQPEKFMEFHKHFKKLGCSYGGIFELRTPFLLVCDPFIIKDVLVKGFSSFHDRGMSCDEHFDPLTAHLLLLSGPKWKYLRSKLTPAFSTGKLKTMISSFVEAATTLMNIWNDAADSGEILDIRELMAQYTTDVIGLCAFGLELNSFNEESSTFRKMGRKLMAPNKKEKILQIIRNNYPWIYKTFKLRMVSPEMTEYFINVLRETMEYRKVNNIDKNDFLNYLMKIRDVSNIANINKTQGNGDDNTSVQHNAIELTEGVIAAQAFIFFLAGFETTATTLCFCLHELAENQNIQLRMQKEIDEGLKKHGKINIDFLQDLKYMEQVVQETLRKYPAAPLLMRICTEPYKLPDSNIVLKPGTHLFIAPYSMHHDPEYFPNPQNFDPERFAPENKDKIVPYSFLPFGEGPRACIGMRFAMLEMKTILSILMSNFTVIKCEKTKPIRIDPSAFILTPLDGFWLKAVKRQ